MPSTPASSRASAAEEQWSHEGILDHLGHATLIRESWPNMLIKMRSGRTLVDTLRGKDSDWWKSEVKTTKDIAFGILGTFEVEGARNRCRARPGNGLQGRKGGNVQSDRS